MLTRIPSGRILHFSDLIKEALCNAAPPFVEMTESKQGKILLALQEDRMTAWLITFNQETYAIALTKIIQDDCMEERDLLLYCAYAVRKLTEEMWDDCFMRMAKYALAMNCTAMTAYTVVERIKEMAVRMGGNISTVYLNIPLTGVKS